MTRFAMVVVVIACSVLASCDQRKPAAGASEGGTKSQETAEAGPAAESAEAPGTPGAEGAPSDSTPKFSVVVPEGWVVVQTTAKRRVLTKPNADTQTPDATVIITRSSYAPSDEVQRRGNAEQFASRVNEWEFSGRPATKKVSGLDIPAYESVRRGTHRKSGAQHAVLTTCLYFKDATVTVLGMCVDNDNAETHLESMRKIAAGVTIP